nr:bifunctional hydroxymethylpyrimidine kinase/phosphomethylpyrimidine kinase [uncultured Sellimonas sp.]
MKRLLMIHDLCSVGKAAMMNMIPILNTMEVEVCPLPTMLLSTHTGGFGKPAIFPVPGAYLKECIRHYQREHITFDCIFTGYLGTEEMADTVNEILMQYPEVPVIMDPIMGDNGRYYSNFDDDYKEALLPLVRKADILLPNLTEAALLCDIPFERCEKEESRLIDAMRRKMKADFILTGVPSLERTVKIAVCCKERTEIITESKIPYVSHGTGDLFDAVFTGAWLQGESCVESARKAHEFVAQCLMEKQKEATSERAGIPFEKLLGKLV